MKKERKICCRITPGRIIGSVLLAASVVNLIIVGTAFQVAFPDPVPTNTATMTFLPATATAGSTLTVTVIPTDTMTPTGISTSTPTSTSTGTATVTLTSTFIPSPVPTQCVPRYDWPAYRIQRGDTLFWLAQATGSSVHELMLANCLLDSRIFAGQLLHVPRLPIRITTAAPIVIPSDTPVTPSNSPTEFKPYGMTCDGPFYVSLSLAVYDADGVVSVDVRLYNDQDERIAGITMSSDENVYYGSPSLPRQFTVYDIAYYRFRAVDALQNVTTSQPYRNRSANCIPIPTDTPTDIPESYPQ